MWKKGQSGNPLGRPKVVGEVRDLARLHTRQAVETLVKIMRNSRETGAARAAAASQILDRGYGRPAQVVDATITQRTPDEMSDAELRVIAASADDIEPTLN